MKRIIALLLIALFAVSLSACDVNDPDDDKATADLSDQTSGETEKYPSENRLISAYQDSNPNYTDARVMYYYGIYNDNVVAMMDHGGNYFGEIWSEKIGETSIEYRNSNRIVVLIENNTFLTLTEAYGQGLLSDADIADIAAKHKGFLK